MWEEERNYVYVLISSSFHFASFTERICVYNVCVCVCVDFRIFLYSFISSHQVFSLDKFSCLRNRNFPPYFQFHLFFVSLLFSTVVLRYVWVRDAVVVCSELEDQFCTSAAAVSLRKERRHIFLSCLLLLLWQRKK